MRALSILCPVAVAILAIAGCRARPPQAPTAAQIIQKLQTKILVQQDEMKKLDEVSALPPEYPGWMIPFQNVNRLADVPRF